MSKLSALGHFFEKLATVAPDILALTPLAPIAGRVQAAIADAEYLKGPGTGADKLSHVVNIAVDAATAANLQAGHQVIDPVAVQAEAGTVISAVVQAVNLAQLKAA